MRNVRVMRNVRSFRAQAAWAGTRR